MHLQTTLVAWMNIANWLRSTLASTETGLKKQPIQVMVQLYLNRFSSMIFPDSLGFVQRHRVTFQALDELRGVAKPVTGRGQGELR